MANALEELAPGNGSDYIGKIIQVEFDVPDASTKDMQDLLFKGLDDVVSSPEKKPYFDEERWRDLFYEYLWRYFKNLRDIKRFSASFAFYFKAHLNEGVLEVDLVDLIVVEVIRVFDNEAYQKLSGSFLPIRQSATERYGDKKQRRAEFQRKLEKVIEHHVNSDERERLSSLLTKIFPQVAENGFSEDASMEWRRRSRICDEASFHRYFNLTIDKSTASQLDLNLVMDVAHDRARTVELLRVAIENKTIHSLLTLILYARDDLPLKAMSEFTTALYDLGDEYPEKEADPFKASCSTLALQIIHHRLKHEDSEAVYKILLDANKTTVGFDLPIFHLSTEDETARQEGKRAPDEYLIPEAKIDDFREMNLKKIREQAKNRKLLEHHKCYFILLQWAKWGQVDEVKKWIGSLLEEPHNSLKLLTSLLGETTHCENSKIMKESFLCAKSFEQFVDLNLLYESVQKVPPNDRSNKANEAIILLKIAIKKKEEGVDYSRFSRGSAE